MGMDTKKALGVKELYVGRLYGESSSSPLIVGSGSSSYSLVSEEDLVVSGKLEVSGLSYLDGGLNCYGNLRIYNDQEIQIGSLADNRLDHSTAQTSDCLVLGLDQVSRSFIICEHDDRNVNFGHAAASSPTLFIHSGDATDTSQYMELTHDETDALISSGSGDIFLDPAGNVKFGTYAAITTETNAGFITINDAGGTPRKICVVA